MERTQVYLSPAQTSALYREARRAGELARFHRRSHVGIGTVDYLIDASARSLGARLVTLNVAHFPMFPDLEPAYR